MGGGAARDRERWRDTGRALVALRRTRRRKTSCCTRRGELAAAHGLRVLSACAARRPSGDIPFAALHQFAVAVDAARGRDLAAGTHPGAAPGPGAGGRPARCLSGNRLGAAAVELLDRGCTRR
ncbi:hypothetical protein LT493_09985 [Streptomyces tricolor]|nr:hypothetical protein [Streptomyces tricolor]